MRDRLRHSMGRIAFCASLAALTCAFAAPAQAQGKVVRSEAADRMPDPGVAPSTKPAQSPSSEAAAAKPDVAAKTAAKSKPSQDANAPEPLSERAQAALDRAKQALAEEAMEDFVPEQPPQAQAIVGQSVKAVPKSASAAPKAAVKCVAGC